MKKTSGLGKFLIWRVKHLSDRRFLIVLSLLIGIISGLAAVIIRYIVKLIEHQLIGGFSSGGKNYFYFLFPAIGIFLAVIFIKYILRKPVGKHGVPDVLKAISKNNGIIPRHSTYASLVTSSLTVGFGGSNGLEGPIIATGAAIGSNIGRIFHLDHKHVNLLLACACSGATAAIFKAPIAALLFSLEIIMLDISMWAVIPLLVASASAVLTAFVFQGQYAIYHFVMEKGEGFILSDIPWYLVLGLVAGLVSVYFHRMFKWTEGVFSKVSSIWMRWGIGASVLGLMIFLLPSLYGEGYEALNKALEGDTSYLFDNAFYYNIPHSTYSVLGLLLAIILVKVFATATTLSAGGVGGIFAPTLFVGANVGLFTSQMLRVFGVNMVDKNFVLVGMAGLIAGVVHAPLTAIFLIAELTGGYALIVPLMIVATIAYSTNKYFIPNSLYTAQLAQEKALITHDKDKAILMRMNMDKCLEKDFTPVNLNGKLGDLVKVIRESKRNAFPVLDDDGDLHGIVHLNNIRHIMFDVEQYDTPIREIMHKPMAYVHPGDSMEIIAQKIQESGHYNVPVTKEGKYIGFVSRANVFSSYRRMLKHISDD